ncbi:MAG: formylmethanofuran dehydrogenase subunit A [Hyphomicrobiales bacterium]|nr:formylmethanofuran dehydrogenase subunit A [Hyphomicrobiales bacterium]
MLTRLQGGRVIDPTRGLDGRGDVYFDDGRILATPSRAPDVTIDVSGCIVMAGALDIHSHIAGANVSTARLLLPEAHRAHMTRPETTWLGEIGFSAAETGRLYAEMGFTFVVEPAISPQQALHAHLELADIPVIDKGLLAVLGNDDFTLGLIRDGAGRAALADVVGATLAQSRALGIKVINAGAAAAFKYNLRGFSLDDVVPHYGVSSRAILEALQQAVLDAGAHHPLHVHANNLGLAGNVETAKATIAAARGMPMHLAHIQFYAYGREGARGFSSAAAELAEVINAHPHVSVDVGQVMFQPTVTISSDIMRQFNGLGEARPRKGIIQEGEGNGGGVVPLVYARDNFFNALQWAAGLELFLGISNPAQVFFTTDHPNGAPFTTYPTLMALLMSADLRDEWCAGLPAEALALTHLPSMRREYSLNELAIMTRSAPATLFGMRDRGHLGAGARADVAVYADQNDRAAMFAKARLVIKNGVTVVRDGKVCADYFGRTLALAARADAAMLRRLEAHSQTVHGINCAGFDVPTFAMPQAHAFEDVACRS